MRSINENTCAFCTFLNLIPTEDGNLCEKKNIIIKSVTQEACDEYVSFRDNFRKEESDNDTV